MSQYTFGSSGSLSTTVDQANSNNFRTYTYTIGAILMAALFTIPRRELNIVHLPEIIGTIIGTLFCAVIVAYIARGRHGDMYGFSQWLFWGTLLCASMISIQVRQRERDRVNALVQEVAGVKSPDNTDKSEEEMKVRDFGKAIVADIEQAGTEYNNKQSENKRLLYDLYEPTSYVSSDRIYAIIKTLDQDIKDNEKFYSQIEVVPQMVEKRVNESSLSPESKSHFMTGFHQSADSPDSELHLISTLTAERQELDVEIISLYSFVWKNREHCFLKNGAVVIDKRSVLEEFNKRSDCINALSYKVKADADKIIEKHQQNLAKYGIQSELKTPLPSR